MSATEQWLVFNAYQTAFFSYQVMLNCWNEVPDKRPTFTQLVTQLDLLLTVASEKVSVMCLFPSHLVLFTFLFHHFFSFRLSEHLRLFLFVQVDAAIVVSFLLFVNVDEVVVYVTLCVAVVVPAIVFVVTVNLVVTEVLVVAVAFVTVTFVIDNNMLLLLLMLLLFQFLFMLIPVKLLFPLPLLWLLSLLL